MRFPKTCGGTRLSALWGRGGKGAVCLLVLVLAAAAVGTAKAGAATKAFVPAELLAAAKENPSGRFDVVVRARFKNDTAAVAKEVTGSVSARPGKAKGIKRAFRVISAVDAELTGRQILGLSHSPKILSITPDSEVGQTALSNVQLWPAAAGVSSLWSSLLPAPTIAIVDSGVDAARAGDFGARVIVQASLYSGTGANSPGDGRGHGTMVASVAAGEGAGYAGAAPGARIVSLDVLDDNGTGSTSDVIAAADWIYRNKDVYGIRVANFSLHGSQDSSVMYDPLDAAVEKLWLSGVVVVTAAGNYAQNGQPSGVRYAPANDPFVITVGAADLSGTLVSTDDFAAPWSAYGATFDGFAKPELGAPGRSMNGAVPVTATMYAERPERVVAPGYMWMSGTSFAAPVVAGAAAHVLAAHPTWTPDQVKGALMLTAQPYSGSSSYSLGVGTVSAAAAAAVVDPPNPNLALNKYVVTDTSGTAVFDSASWASAAQADPSWASASWASASWNSASWASASWASASWASASWASASWASASWASASWNSASWASSTWVE